MALKKGTLAVNSHPSSYFPLAMVGGLLLAVPITFILYFITHNGQVALISAIIGIPLFIWAAVGLVMEGMKSSSVKRGWNLAGLPLFFISESMIFFTLFAGCTTIRLNSDAWPPEGADGPGVTIPIVITILLALSGITMRLMEIRLAGKQIKEYIRFQGITVALGAFALGLLICEQYLLSIGGFNFGENAQTSGYYCITGFYEIHLIVAVGMLLLQYILALSGKVRKAYISSLALVWYYLLFVWLFLVSLVYFW